MTGRSGAASRRCSARIHRSLEHTLHRALTVNEGHLCTPAGRADVLPCPVGSAGSNAGAGHNARQPVSRPLGQLLIARTRWANHAGTCSTHARYSSRWSEHIQMVVFLALDAIEFGIWSDRFQARPMLLTLEQLRSDCASPPVLLSGVIAATTKISVPAFLARAHASLRSIPASLVMHALAASPQ